MRKKRTRRKILERRKRRKKKRFVLSHFSPCRVDASFYLYPIYFYSQEDDHTEIDPSAILPPGTRRSARGAKVDYASAEALAKAGLKPETANEDEDDDDDSMSHD